MAKAYPAAVGTGHGAPPDYTTLHPRSRSREGEPVSGPRPTINHAAEHEATPPTADHRPGRRSLRVVRRPRVGAVFLPARRLGRLPRRQQWPGPRRDRDGQDLRRVSRPGARMARREPRPGRLEPQDPAGSPGALGHPAPRPRRRHRPVPGRPPPRAWPPLDAPDADRGYLLGHPGTAATPAAYGAGHDTGKPHPHAHPPGYAGA